MSTEPRATGFRARPDRPSGTRLHAGLEPEDHALLAAQLRHPGWEREVDRVAAEYLRALRRLG